MSKRSAILLPSATDKVSKRSCRSMRVYPQDLFNLLNLNPYNDDHMSKYDDNAVLEAIRQNPDFASKKTWFTARDGNIIYPLSQAVALRASLDVVRLLYESFPDAARDISRPIMWTPLHFACIYGAPFEVVSFLADKNLEALEVKTWNGMYPLHCACKYSGTDVKTVGMLAERYPPAMDAKDEDGMTPLMYVWPSPDAVTSLTTLHALLCLRSSDEEIGRMLLESNGEMWNCRVGPVLRWRGSVVRRIEIPSKLIPTLFGRIGQEGSVQTMFQMVTEWMELWGHVNH